MDHRKQQAKRPSPRETLYPNDGSKHDFPTLTVARCPKCNAPMTTRYGNSKRFFTCKCTERN